MTAAPAKKGVSRETVHRALLAAVAAALAIFGYAKLDDDSVAERLCPCPRQQLDAPLLDGGTTSELPSH